MNNQNKKQEIQEQKYKFPYHYIPTYSEGNFSQVKILPWGYEYLSYLRFILNILKKLEFNSLLDVGCGDGRFLYEVYHIFPQKKIVGIDISERAIKFARLMNPRVKYFHGDVKDTSLIKEKFDIITLIETLEHIPPREIKDFLGGIHHYLKDEGILILTVPTTNLKVTPKHYQHFDLDSLKDTLDPYFNIFQYYFINKISIWEKLIQRLLVDKLFILNIRCLLNNIFSIYEKYLFYASENNAKRICALCKKNNRNS